MKNKVQSNSPKQHIFPKPFWYPFLLALYCLYHITISFCLTPWHHLTLSVREIFSFSLRPASKFLHSPSLQFLLITSLYGHMLRHPFSFTVLTCFLSQFLYFSGVEHRNHFDTNLPSPCLFLLAFLLNFALRPHGNFLITEILGVMLRTGIRINMLFQRI